MTTVTDSGERLTDVRPLPGVADIVAVSSAKGGVGKSTVAVNLACALVQRGQRVALLDADVYGPSLPIMVGLSARPQVVDTSKIIPLEKYGLKLMSLGFFLSDKTPVIWRGPMVTGVIRQFLTDIQWGDIDVLVIDLPPGTGDTQLTLVQQVPLSGGVIVTTPQEVSLIDVERGVAMFNQVNAPVLGVVENMSYYLCPKCGEREAIFGSGGGARIAEEFGVPLLAQVPLVPEVRASGDAGTPIVIEDPDHPVSRIFLHLAGKVIEGVEA
jgi:ATP-binding protein involved in chromosome partitioning